MLNSGSHNVEANRIAVVRRQRLFVAQLLEVCYYF